MDTRLNRINTQFEEISGGDIGEERQLAPLLISPRQKIKVFISSICGVERYDEVRKQLKIAIENTQLAEVYTFEGKGASTLTAGNHYTWALEDSDVCIFLIDNADGINPGVQAEIDTVKKHNIKALYYFCDETQAEKTALEQSLMGSHFAKSKTVHNFSELSHDGAQSLIDDIIAVYHYYCTARLVPKTDYEDETQSIEVVGTENYQLPTIPKTTLKNVDKCRDYIYKFVLGYSRGKFPDETEKTSSIDDWGLQFLRVLFEGNLIKNFNASMYLEELQALQEIEYHPIVQTRWQAIQSYFSGDIEKCVQKLESALKLAKETNQPIWVIKDILIDLRNQHWTRCTINNQYFNPTAQTELTESNEELYYPILDRIHGALHEKYIEGLYKKKTESPYSVSLGSNLDQYGEMLASSLIVSMYNGSLTHILLLYEKIRDFAFYLSCKYDDWNLRLNLYKLAIFAGKEKEIKGIQDSYPEILNNLSSDEAKSIMDFCLNHPIDYKRLNSQLLAFGAVGYFLDDSSFEHYKKYIVDEIKFWLDNDKSVFSIGQNIFKCLSDVAYRIPQDTLCEICCLFIDKHYSRWYMDMFKFISNRIDLTEMTDKSAKNLIEHINTVLDDEKEREQINHTPTFLCVLRKQNRDLTNDMDSKIARYFPTYYDGVYKLETMPHDNQEFSIFIKKYIDDIKKSNETQGKNGVYFGHGTREIATIRAILLEEDIICESEMMDELITVVADTLLFAKESISTKLDAISLLICVLLNYPESFKHNQSVYERLFDQQNAIETTDCSFLSSNIDDISLKIGLLFLYTAMGKDVYGDVLEIMPYIQNDIATSIAVSRLIIKYLETNETIVLPQKIDAIVLQNALQWVRSECLDLRWNATRILLALSRNKDNHGVINHQLVTLVDSNGAHIKNLIMRQIHKCSGITDTTKEYIISKCKYDANFTVRKVCTEFEGEISQTSDTTQ